MMTTEEMVLYDQVVEYGIATPEELNLAFNLVGNSWTEAINSVIYIRTGYRDFDSYFDGEWELDDDDEEEGMLA